MKILPAEGGGVHGPPFGRSAALGSGLAERAPEPAEVREVEERLACVVGRLAPRVLAEPLMYVSGTYGDPLITLRTPLGRGL
jgi:hypothetical protein